MVMQERPLRKNTTHSIKKLFLVHPQPFELQNEFPDRTGPMACLPVSVHGSVQLTEFPERTGPMACLQWVSTAAYNLRRPVPRWPEWHLCRRGPAAAVTMLTAAAADAACVCTWTGTTEFSDGEMLLSLLSLLMSWCLMSSDVIWHIRDKLWPMPKHGSIKATYVRCMCV